MALINCPECGNQVSNTAAACPHCGAPIAESTGAAAVGAPLTTVQETSKRLKLQILISSLLFWGGIIGIVVAANEQPPREGGAPLAALSMMVGSL